MKAQLPLQRSRRRPVCGQEIAVLAAQRHPPAIVQSRLGPHHPLNEAVVQVLQVQFLGQLFLDAIFLGDEFGQRFGAPPQAQFVVYPPLFAINAEQCGQVSDILR